MKKLLSLIKKYPVVSYGVTLIPAIAMLFSLGIEYDSHILATLLFVALPVLAFPYWFARETLYGLNDGRSFEGVELITLIIGLIIFALLELAYQLLRWRNKRFQRG